MITTSKELGEHLREGWELWYIACPSRLPGRWQVRRGGAADSKRVHWDAIVKFRRANWWKDQIIETEESGRCWSYRLAGAQPALDLRS